MFYEHPDKISETTSTFYKILKKHGKIKGRPNFKKWNKDLQELEKESSLTSVLKWLEENPHHMLAKHIYSPNQLKNNFQQIKATIHKTIKDNNHLVNDIANLGDWPPEIKSNLSNLIDLSIINIDKFILKIKKELETNNHNTRKRTFLKYIILSLGSGYQISTLLFVWFRIMQSKYCKIDHFSGDITNLVFDPKSYQFLTSFWGNWIYEFTCREDAELLKYHTELFHK